MSDFAVSMFHHLDSAKLPFLNNKKAAASETGEKAESKQPSEKYFATDWSVETKNILSQELAEKEARQICKKASCPHRTEHLGWESVPGKKYAPVQGNKDFTKLHERIKTDYNPGEMVEEKIEIAVEQLFLGKEISGTAKYNVDMCYFVRMMQPTATLVITLVPTDGDPDLYCSTKAVATHKKYTWRSMLMTGRDRIEITPKDPNFICGNYYITVCNRGLTVQNASYLLTASAKSRMLQTLRVDQQVVKLNRLHMKQLKIATIEADDKVASTSVASGWGKWRNCATKSDVLRIEDSKPMTPSVRSSNTPNAAANVNENGSVLKVAIELDMTKSTKAFKRSFVERSRLIFENPIHAIQDVLHGVGSMLASNASQQMFREGTKLMLSRAVYNKQPHFGKIARKFQQLDRNDRSQPREQQQNDSDSEDEILFGGTDLPGTNLLDIDAFVSVGIPPAVLTILLDTSDRDGATVDNSVQWLVGIGKNVPTLQEILDASTASAIVPAKCVLNLSHVPDVPGEFLGFRSGEHLRRIKELSISGCLNILPNQLLKATAVMFMIENLDISNCVQFDTEALLKIMSRLPLLEAINISNCVNVHGLIFDRLIEFPDLRKICSFSNQHIEFESVSRFLGSATKIQHVSLSRSHIFKRMYPSMAVCTSLNLFDVSSCGLTIDVLASIVEKMPNLRSISCAHTKPKLPENANAFFSTLSHIHSIDVSFCTWVTSAHLVSLSQSSPHLHSFCAAGLHQLRDWVIVEMFQNCGHIHVLDCEGWNISNTGLEALSVLGKELCDVSFKAVKEISIDGVEMMLVGCKNICKLNVTHCPKVDQNAVIEAASELCDHYVSIAN